MRSIKTPKVSGLQENEPGYLASGLSLRSLGWRHLDLQQLPIVIRKQVSRFTLQTGKVVKRIKPVHFALFGSIVVVVYSISFLWPRTIAFSYSKTNCFFNPVLLPSLTSKKPSSVVDVHLQDSLSVGGYPLYSQTTCVSLINSPQVGTEEKVSLGALGLKKSITVRPSTFPTLSTITKVDQPLSTKQTLLFKFDQPDQVFHYQLAANEHTAACIKNQDLLECNPQELKLSQSARYDLSLQRVFRDRPLETVWQQSITTVEAVQVTSTSVAEGEMIYGIPSDMTLALNKPAATTQGIKLELIANNARQDIPVTSSIQDNKIIIHFTQPLPRSALFELSVEQINAQDQAYLNSPYSLRFSTSGGPKVVGISIGNYKVQPGSSITLTFDSSLAANQAVGNFVRMETDAGTVATNVTLRGNKVTLTPTSPLARCTAFTVKVLDGLKNDAGVSGGSSWQFKSRIICQTAFSIGTSVQGRSITAYRFGNGPSKIIFVGTTHGNEKSSTHTLNSWIEQLEANYSRIPTNRTIIVIPNLNPDGYAANTRVNANNVDLNRNFPANNWKSGVSMPDGSYLEHGGGTEPLSEPESKALANYVLSQSPRLVLTYHSIGPFVMANESGDSLALARLYGQKSGFRSMGNTASTYFHYDTTGAFEDWLHDKHDVPALLIELATRSSNEFSTQKNAMWAMVE